MILGLDDTEDGNLVVLTGPVGKRMFTLRPLLTMDTRGQHLY